MPLPKTMTATRTRRQKTLAPSKSKTQMKAQDYFKQLTYEIPDLDGEARLRELILYIANKCLTDPTFSKTKLNKILYFADFIAFAKYHKPITGVAYQRLQYGPVPEPMHRLQGEMAAEDDIKVIERDYMGKTQQRVVALRRADLTKFTAQDVELIDDIIQAFWGRRGKYVSQLSHDRAWQATPQMERIPYESVFVSDEPLTDYDITRSHELIRKHQWDV